MIHRMLGLMVLVSAVTLVGCDKKETQEAADKAKAAVGDAAKKTSEAASDAWKAMKDKAVAAAEPKLAELKTHVEALKGKAASVPAAMKPAYDSTMKEIDSTMQTVTTKLGELKTATGDTWQKLSTEASEGLTKLGDLIKGAMEKFKS